MKLLIRKYSPFLLLLVFLSGCETFTNQAETSCRYSIQSFSELYIDGVYHVELMNDTIDYIVITTNPDFQSSFLISQDSFQLTIKDNISVKYLRDLRLPKIEVHFTNINRLIIDGTSKIYNRDTLKIDNLLVASGGESADVDLVVDVKSLSFYNNYQTDGIYRFAGKADRLSVSAQAGIFVYANKLHAREKIIRQNSIGDIYTGTCDKLSFEITNRGNIYYSGSPLIDTLGTSSNGQLIYIDE